MTQINIDNLEPWLGRSETKEDILTPGLVEKFRATLGPHLWDGSPEAPPGLHWCLALNATENAELSEDGHEKKGGFLPPVPLPSRMWAGGETTTFAPLQVGNSVTRASRIENITAKQGRSGDLVFVAIRHEYHSAGTLCISERQDIVFRGLRSSTPQENTTRQATPEPDAESLNVRLTPDPLMLFRYSALTFNAHRIHYDHPYATGAENYPGLVVHGPLQATLLFNLAATKAGQVPKTFSFRGLAPMTLPCELQLHSRQTDIGGTVWCQDRDGQRSFSADFSVL